MENVARISALPIRRFQADPLRCSSVHVLQADVAESPWSQLGRRACIAFLLVAMATNWL